MDFKIFANFILKILYYAYGYLSKVYVFFVPLPIVVRLPTIIDFTNQYIEKNKKKFLSTFNAEVTNPNSNIEQEFYNKTDYKQICLDESNTLEKNWKRRVLFETTPRGNIIMFYDAFKMGFAYYSDVNNLRYNLLNAVAMKYVVTFCCRDFFMDDQITPKDNPSPLIKIHAEEQEKKIKVKKTANRTKNNLIKENPEIDDKLKNINYTNNRFICLGKTLNFQFIQKISNDVNGLNGFKSNLLDHLSGESALQTQVMNYKEFKNLRNRKVPTA